MSKKMKFTAIGLLAVAAIVGAVLIVQRRQVRD